MTNLKITVNTLPKTKTRKEKPIDWDNATDNRLLAIAMNSKDRGKIDRAIETLVGRGFVFSRKQANRLLSTGAITSDNL